MIKFPKEAERIEPNPFDYWDEMNTKRNEEIRATGGEGCERDFPHLS